MILAGSFAGAVEVAEQNCSEWLLAGNGEVFHAEELHEVAKEFDAQTPLAEDEFLVVTDDGSIGLLYSSGSPKKNRQIPAAFSNRRISACFPRQKPAEAILPAGL